MTDQNIPLGGILKDSSAANVDLLDAIKSDFTEIAQSTVDQTKKNQAKNEEEKRELVAQAKDVTNKSVNRIIKHFTNVDFEDEIDPKDYKIE